MTDTDDVLVAFTVAIFSVQHKRAPRVSEISERTGVKRQAVKASLRRLRATGMVRGYDRLLDAPIPLRAIG